MELYILMGLMLVAFIGLNMWSKKNQAKRQAEQDRMMKEQLVPGAWVHTRVGFFGRFVDLDGDVVILETPSGEETYWNKMVISSVGDLPFAVEEDQEDDDFADIPDDASALEETAVETVELDGDTEITDLDVSATEETPEERVDGEDKN